MNFNRFPTGRADQLSTSFRRVAAWGILCGSSALIPQTAVAQQSESPADLAQELTNPLADLITVPVQANFDSDIGPVGDGSRKIVSITEIYGIEDDDILTQEIFKYEQTGVVDLGSGGGNSRANGTNYDGSVAVGWESRSDGVWQPHAWRSRGVESTASWTILPASSPALVAGVQPFR